MQPCCPQHSPHLTTLLHHVCSLSSISVQAHLQVPVLRATAFHKCNPAFWVPAAPGRLSAGAPVLAVIAMPAIWVCRLCSMPGWATSAVCPVERASDSSEETTLPLLLLRIERPERLPHMSGAMARALVVPSKICLAPPVSMSDTMGSEMCWVFFW